MTPLYHIVIPIPPVPWQRAGRSGKRTFDTPRNRDHKLHLQWAARINRVQRIEAPDPVILRVCVVLQRPKRERAWPTAQRDGDADNYAKMLLDAWNGIVWDDDAQVVECTVRKRWAEQGESPKWEIEIGTP